VKNEDVSWLLKEN